MPRRASRTRPADAANCGRTPELPGVETCINLPGIGAAVTVRVAAAVTTASVAVCCPVEASCAKWSPPPASPRPDCGPVTCPATQPGTTDALLTAITAAPPTRRATLPTGRFPMLVSGPPYIRPITYPGESPIRQIKQPANHAAAWASLSRPHPETGTGSLGRVSISFP